MLILVVEDDPTVRRVLDTALGHLGELEQVTDQEEAAAAVAARRPDVVLLDVMLQGRSGLSLLAHWRADGELEDLPVIVLTGLDDVMERRAGTAAGADAYITKPFDPEHLVAVIEQVTGPARAARSDPVLPN